MTNRVCGGCTLCCRFYGVPELGKPEQERCRHCTASGCSIHETRPASCRNFDCFWLMDENFPDDLRPDRCGVVAWWNGADHGSAVLHVDPDRPDALAKSPGSELLRAVLAGFARVFVVCGEERVMLRGRT
jgi:hypothetical protein